MEARSGFARTEQPKTVVRMDYNVQLITLDKYEVVRREPPSPRWKPAPVPRRRPRAAGKKKQE